MWTESKIYQFIGALADAQAQSEEDVMEVVDGFFGPPREHALRREKLREFAARGSEEDVSAPEGEDVPRYVVQADNVAAAGALERMADVMDNHEAPSLAAHYRGLAAAIRTWQEIHGCKVPDMQGGGA